jgi:hypothetical protein
MGKKRKNRCVICNKNIPDHNKHYYCDNYYCEEKFELLTTVTECPDPVVRGRMRDERLESTTMSTAWSIRKKHISKQELLHLKQKYEPDRYKILEISKSKKKTVRRTNEM